VREYDRLFALSSDASHKMAILGMDQFGLLLSNIMPNSRVFRQLKNAKELSGDKAVSIFLPSHLMFQENPLANSWDVTSDSIAAYVAGRVNAEKVVLATDVDGVFTSDPKKNPNAKLMEKLSAKKLLTLSQRTSVDRYLPNLLLKTQIDCYVVNGKNPERVEAVLAGQQTTCTLVSART
jgi:hypothetical protein